MGTTARLDRTLLSLLGLLLTTAGALGLLTGSGVFGSRLRRQRVLHNPVSTFVGRHGTWLWPLIALLGLALGYLALRWLIAQLRPARVSDLQLEPHTTTGQTELVGAAVTDAVTDEISAYRGVTSASARLLGDERDPQLQLRVRLDNRADVTALRQRIQTEAVANLRRALDNPQLPVRLDLVVTDKKAARVS